MSISKHSACYLTSLLVGLAYTGTAAAVPASGDPVLFWNEVLLTGTPYNPGQQRPAAMLNIAIHDAVNASLGAPDFGYLGVLATPGGDTRAAASVAAHDILVKLYPARAAQFDAALVASLALVADGGAKTAGIATGGIVAAATIANRLNDHSFDVVTYTPSGLPGGWAPTPPGFGPPAMPQQATVTPYLMTSPSQFRVAPPPLLTSAQYTAAFNEVKEIGAIGSLARTADQTLSAKFWATTQGPGPWITAAIGIAGTKGLSTLENARLFALLSTSVADAITSVWDSKFYYDYWRPVTGIRAADTDGNVDTVSDPNWTPLIVTPSHQSYSSAHATISGAAATILELTLGNTDPFCVTSLAATRCWANFGDAATDSVNSRLWAGVHWRFDNEAGFAAGQAIGRFAFASTAFAAVPEPAAWALLITGFALTGTAMRRRRTYRAV